MDPTEKERGKLVHMVNRHAGERKVLEELYNDVWDTGELQKDFVVIRFMAPFIEVKRKKDNKKGTMMFQHRPRYYFDFNPE